jgi:hypothetical protein
MFLGMTPVSSVSNSLYFLTLPLVSVMHVIYTSKGMSKSLGWALSIEKYSNLFGHQPGSAQFYVGMQPRLQIVPYSLLMEEAQFT